MDKLKQITELVKSLTPDTVKTFDMGQFNDALKTIAQLIIQEATELGEGSDEQDSLNNLIAAVSSLFSWYKGEVSEGEVNGVILEYKEDNYWMEAVQEAVKTVMVNKSVPSIVDPAAVIEVPVAVEPVAVEPVAVESVVVEPVAVESVAVELTEISEPEVITNVVPEVSGETDIKTLVEEAVKSALGEVKSNIVAQFESVIKTVESDNTKLKSELETALNKVAGGGAKRTATKMSDKSKNDKLIQAEDYESKAAATTDKKLAEGYRDIAKGLRAELTLTN